MTKPSKTDQFNQIDKKANSLFIELDLSRVSANVSNCAMYRNGRNEEFLADVSHSQQSNSTS